MIEPLVQRLITRNTKQTLIHSHHCLRCNLDCFVSSRFFLPPIFFFSFEIQLAGTIRADWEHHQECSDVTARQDVAGAVNCAISRLQGDVGWHIYDINTGTISGAVL